MSAGVNKITARTCGDCAACCTWLGVLELKKHSGQTCHYLDGRHPAARCVIYDSRPEACSHYVCAWRGGVLADTSRPDRVGFIVSAYEPRFVIQVFDEAISGDIQRGALYEALRVLLTSTTIPEVIVCYPRSKVIFQFRDGCIWRGRLLTQRSYEDLKFERFEPPLARYETTAPPTPEPTP